jgi:hypothetical protein
MDHKINVNRVKLIFLFEILKFVFEIYLGKHHLLLLENVQSREFVTPEIIDASPNSRCLTFYYYLTKPDIILLLTDYLNIEGQRKLISAFVNVPFNGWHLARESFKPNSTSYRVDLS